MYIIYKHNTHGILLQNSSTGLELFWDDFPKIIRVRIEPTHPPTSIVNADFFIFFYFLCNAPKENAKPNNAKSWNV